MGYITNHPLQNIKLEPYNGYTTWYQFVILLLFVCHSKNQCNNLKSPDFKPVQPDLFSTLTGCTNKLQTVTCKVNAATLWANQGSSSKLQWSLFSKYLKFWPQTCILHVIPCRTYLIHALQLNTLLSEQTLACVFLDALLMASSPESCVCKHDEFVDFYFLLFLVVLNVVPNHLLYPPSKVIVTDANVDKFLTVLH